MNPTTFSYTVSDPKELRALAAVTAQYNAGQPDAPLDAAGYANFVFLPVLKDALASWAAQFAIATITSAAFVLRFTPAEITAITASADANVQGYLQQLNTHPNVVLTDDLTTQGVAYLQSVGLIAAGRAAQILAF